MIDYLGGTDITVTIPLIRNGFPIIPTPGSVTYTLYDHALLPITGHVNVALTTDSSTVSLTIPILAASNTIAVGKSFERRKVVATFLSGGTRYTFHSDYRLVPLLNHNVTPQSVRAFIGTSEKELPDTDIDLTAAYFEVEQDFGQVSLSTTLASGTLAELAANEAIRMRAVISVLPSLRQRLAQMESNGVYEFRRGDMRQLDALERQAWDRYVKARDRATSAPESEVTLVLTTTDADPVTGA